MSFFDNLDELLISGVVIDRGRGTAHPRYADVVYPVDYGYIFNTSAGDGQGIDVFRGTAAGLGVVGVYLTADVGKRDAEIKVVLDRDANEVQAVGKLLGESLRIGGLFVPRPPFG